MNAPQRYRKKPVEIEAIQLTRENVGAAEEFIHGKAEARKLSGPGRGLVDGVVIHTLEGDMRASWGDWIIRGVAGEVYPCRDDIFQATYEAVEVDS